MTSPNQQQNELKKQLSDCQEKLNSLKKEYELSYLNYQQLNARFLQRISQDIIMPLNGILASCKNAGDRAQDKPPENRPGVLHSVNYLMSVVQGLSVFASLLKGEVRQESREFSVYGLYKELIANNQPLASVVKVELKQVFYSGIPDPVEGDYLHIRQILSGFLSNALKNTKNGSVALSAEITERDKGSLKARFMVSDTGKGMDGQHQIEIKKELKENSLNGLMMHDNLGLGLLLAHHLSEKLGGVFDFKSDKGVGSSFWIDIPLKEKQSPAPAEKGKKHPFTASTKRKILLVEDNYLNQKFVAAALLKAGHSIEIAENGKVALEKYNSKKYDLILMDIQLPLIDGFETTKKIRRLEKKYRKPAIPIIAVTAYAIEHDREQCLDAGMNEYLTKPFKPIELLQLIDAI